MSKLCLSLILLPVRALAGGSGGRIVLVADSRRFSGWQAWWASLYNESHVYFTLLTIIIILGLALVLNKATDLVMTRIGINLKSRVLEEH